MKNKKLPQDLRESIFESLEQLLYHMSGEVDKNDYDEYEKELIDYSDDDLIYYRDNWLFDDSQVDDEEYWEFLTENFFHNMTIAEVKIYYGY